MYCMSRPPRSVLSCLHAPSLCTTPLAQPNHRPPCTPLHVAPAGTAGGRAFVPLPHLTPRHSSRSITDPLTPQHVQPAGTAGGANRARLPEARPRARLCRPCSPTPSLLYTFRPLAPAAARPGLEARTGFADPRRARGPASGLRTRSAPRARAAPPPAPAGGRCRGVRGSVNRVCRGGPAGAPRVSEPGSRRRRCQLVERVEE
mmetsp:Transcript_4904/g.10845  ORF Transcript_4904/g.10845 Transcript_4904/m.10845 type:complete len:203 (-) Transcript_4904:225-833(-)